MTLNGRPLGPLAAVAVIILAGAFILGLAAFGLASGGLTQREVFTGVIAAVVAGVAGAGLLGYTRKRRQQDGRHRP